MRIRDGIKELRRVRARELPDGRLQLIDGHLRAETTLDDVVPVLVLDVIEEEADKLLQEWPKPTPGGSKSCSRRCGTTMMR
jgi:hypothetical protein